MTEHSFQTEVLTRLGRIELMITGVTGDPNNQGIHGKLLLVDREIEYLRQQDKTLSKRVSHIANTQDRQRMWLKGAMVGYGLSGAGLVAVLARLYDIGPL